MTFDVFEVIKDVTIRYLPTKVTTSLSHCES